MSKNETISMTAMTVLLVLSLALFAVQIGTYHLFA